MKVLVFLGGVLGIVITTYVYHVQNHSYVIINKESTSLNGEDVLREIQKLPDKYGFEKQELHSVISDFQKYLKAGMLGEEAPVLDGYNNAELNEELDELYSSVGLEYTSINNEIIKGFDSASSDIESISELSE